MTTTKVEGEGLPDPLPAMSIYETPDAVALAGQVLIAEDRESDSWREWDRYAQLLVEYGYLDASGNITDEGKEWLKDAF